MVMERLHAQQELRQLLGLKTVPTNFEGMSLMRLQAGIRLASRGVISAELQLDGTAQMVRRLLPAGLAFGEFVQIENDWRLFAEADASALLAFAVGSDMRTLLQQFGNQRPLPHRAEIPMCCENADGTADWVTEAAKSVVGGWLIRTRGLDSGGVQPQCSDRSETSHSAGNGTSAE